MFHRYLRFPQLRRAATLGMVLAVFAAVFMLGVGALLALRGGPEGERPSPLAVVASLAAGSALLSWVVATWCLLEISGKVESHTYRGHDVLLDIKTVLEEQNRLLVSIDESTRLSDAALSIAHREREQAVLRQAINEDILREDWEGAYYLVEQLERRFGYKMEAEQLRREIDSSRSTLIERKLQEATGQIRGLIAAHDWDRARRGMEQLMKHHPEHAGVRELPAELEARFDEHKRRLLKDWDQAVQRDDVDEGIRVLKELDQYLSPSEAEALKEGARDVFRAKLHNLGVQFSLAVTERQWEKAMEIGQQIVEQFPNSRMANEVRGKFEVLQHRIERSRSKAAAQAAG